MGQTSGAGLREGTRSWGYALGAFLALAALWVFISSSVADRQQREWCAQHVALIGEQLNDVRISLDEPQVLLNSYFGRIQPDRAAYLVHQTQASIDAVSSGLQSFADQCAREPSN